MHLPLDQDETRRVLHIAELLPETIKLLVRHISAMPELDRLALLQKICAEMHQKEVDEFLNETGLNLDEENNKITELVSNSRKEYYESTVNH